MLEGLDEIMRRIDEKLSQMDQAREQAYQLSRHVVREASAAIKSAHRGQMDAARDGLQRTGDLVRHMLSVAAPWPQLRYAGFVTDAEKEYAEAAVVIAAMAGEPAPDPADLGIDEVAWLNGTAEAVGELRRHVLDLIRQGRPEDAEPYLSLMEDLYSWAMAFDYPNAITAGLRSRSDQARGAVERTRGELTLALQNQQLIRHLQRAYGQASDLKADGPQSK